MASGDSLTMSMADGSDWLPEPRVSSPATRASADDLATIGSTRWGSPPPGLSTNLLIFSTLGLWLAVLLLLRGEQILLWVLT